MSEPNDKSSQVPSATPCGAADHLAAVLAAPGPARECGVVVVAQALDAAGVTWPPETVRWLGARVDAAIDAAVADQPPVREVWQDGYAAGVAAERERAATIADETTVGLIGFVESDRMDFAVGNMRKLREMIAAAIRGGTDAAS